jgi:hypothetical protein
MIVLGADMHKSSHTIAGIAAATGEMLGDKTGAPVELWVTPAAAPGSIPRQTDDSELGGPRRKLRSFSPMPSGPRVR